MTSVQDVIPVKVYVRSRPFNSRENAEHAVACLTFDKETNQVQKWFSSIFFTLDGY